MHWKIARDPFLGPLAARGGEKLAYDAGFFLDEDPEDARLDDTDWRCTPVPARRPLGPRPIALLATGGFCPPHAGHLAMMQAARAAAEHAGFDVIAGYLSPGHDAYLKLKCRSEAIPASERLARCAALATETDWLLVDPWEALHRRVAVNYTDVVARLRAYLRAHLDNHVDVFYVCGGDNARFAPAFVEDAGCVVVSRPGYEGEREKWRRILGPRPNILWCESQHAAASRELRSGPWLERATRRVALRLEDERAAPLLGFERLRHFQRALVRLFAEFATVRSVPLAPPSESLDPAISLDAMLPSRHSLAISRLFALGGYHALGHVERPGSRPLRDQIRALPPGSYVLRDDDSFTGGTVNAVRALLPADVRITRLEVALHSDADEEVADSRDFLLGAHEGGLVVRLADGQIGRVPYLLPYVDPAVRSGVPFELSHDFSRRAWLLNERIFQGTHILIRDLPAHAQRAFAWFSADRSLEQLSQFYADRLGSSNCER